MTTCQFCSKAVESLRGYVLHCKVHRNEPRCIFSCVGTECKRTFCNYAAFKAHFYRAHNTTPSLAATSVVSDFKCAVSLCARYFQTVRELISHLKEHIVEGRAVACPVAGCSNSFTVKSSFTAHMSRKHRACSVNDISDLFKETIPQSPCEEVLPNPNDDTENESMELPDNLSENFLRNACLFYLKLQGQLLLPASTIQTIVEEMQNVHEMGQDYTLGNFRALLTNDLSLTDDDVTKICDCIKDSDLFSACHKGPLRTTYSRNQVFKNMFKYVEPVKVPLGNDENMTEKFAYYIPVIKTLKSLLESELWKNSVAQ